MRVGVLGTGMVGRAHGAKLRDRGHDIMIGTRDVERTLARRGGDAMGNPPFGEWLASNPGVMLGTFAQAARHGEVVINATEGAHSIDALWMAGEDNLNGKVLIDVSNPLDFSKGAPPFLFVLNTDSLAERIQAAFPEIKVVKTLNTMNALIQVDPGRLAGGDHHAFVSGNDREASEHVISYLREWYGWRNVIYLGDLTTARGPEMTLPMWLRLFGALHTPMLNFKIVTEKGP